MHTGTLVYANFIPEPLLQDLELLSSGIEGRSGNPVALLYDTLVRPGAELNSTQPSSVRFHKEDESRVIPHAVFGTGVPGGSWQVRRMEHCMVWCGSPKKSTNQNAGIACER